MSDSTTYKLRLPEERYIALMQLAHANDRSINAELNALIKAAISQYLAEVKSGMGHEGVSEDDE